MGHIQGEKDLMISVFTNLLDNAGKAVEQGGRIVVRGRKYSGSYLFCIMDNGCGMEQGRLPASRKPFI